MKAGWVKYILLEAEQSGVDKPEKPSYTDLYLRIAFCVILLLLLI